MTASKTTKRIGAFAMVGIILTVSDYLLFLLFMYFFNQIMVASALAGLLSTGLGFLLHNTITWKDRIVKKQNIWRFFIWNISVLTIIRPFLMWLAVILLDPLCTALYNILNWTNFSPETWSYVVPYIITTAITMTLNFVFYDRFVFKKKEPQNGTK